MPFKQPVLQLGDSGDAVARLQEDLITVGCFAGPADGSFEQSTTDAVMQFQECVGLPVDGVVEAVTWSTLEGPEATVESSIDLADFPAIVLVATHGEDEELDGYLAELGIEPV